MKIGFVSAILPGYSLEQLVEYAGRAGFASVELMCWPPGSADRRYAGVSHLDPADFDPAKVRRLFADHDVEISGLGYYPNLLAADRAAARFQEEHLRKVIDAAAALGVAVVNTFVGRDQSLSVDANWPRFLEVWKPLINHAESRNITIGIENCPMLFSDDEWPGGKNLAATPAVWRRMFADISSPNFGLNYDPSHLIWQRIDYVAPLAEFKNRLVHIHAKDARVDQAALDDHGVLAHPKLWHTPKIPGQGGIHWGAFFGALHDAGYTGHVAIEIEDRAFERSLEARLDALEISRRFLLQFIRGSN